MDAAGWQILSALQEDARLSFHELGRRVGLTAPAVAERVRRLEQAGLITGYRAIVPLDRAGLPLLAFIRVLRMNHERYYDRMLTALQTLPRVIEAYHVAGEDSFILKVAARDTADLEHMIAQLTRLGSSVTSIVLSALVVRTAIDESLRLS